MTTAAGGGAVLASDLVPPYLTRIGHPPVTAPTLEALAGLQDAHVRSVPFENLDIHLGRPLSLDVTALADKVVARRRGGFCYELNGLFAALLAALGYDVHLVEARIRSDDGMLGARFEHMRVIVTVDGEPLLVDVGAGASPRGPIRLDTQPQQVGHERYRVRPSGDGLLSEQLMDGAWVADWWFAMAPRRLTEFAERCRYHQRSTQSHFTHKPVCTLVTTDGQVTLADRALVTTANGRRREETVDDPLAVLAERFGIDLPTWPGS